MSLGNRSPLPTQLEINVTVLTHGCELSCSKLGVRSPAVLHKLGGDSSRESKVVAGWHEQTDTGDLQNHELASVQ